MVKIHRIWFNTERMDREDHYKITLFSRPRVSIHVDEYIWSFIEENIVKPHKLMRSEKHEYLLDIAFGQFDPAKHRYFPLSSYNGLLREGVEMDSANRSYFREDFAGGKDRTTWFSPNKIWTNCGDKVLNVDIKAANVSENITPREYADLLFDGIGAALVFNFKRLKRQTLSCACDFSGSRLVMLLRLMPMVEIRPFWLRQMVSPVFMSKKQPVP